MVGDAPLQPRCLSVSEGGVGESWDASLRKGLQDGADEPLVYWSSQAGAARQTEVMGIVRLEGNGKTSTRPNY